MKEEIGRTSSLCPVCLRVIEASRIQNNGDVYLEKTCSTHGHFETLIWRDATRFTQWGRPGRPGSPGKRFTPREKGCPLDCGLCPDHLQDTCTVLMEVTDRCNLHCPVCFARAGAGGSYNPGLDAIRDMFETLLTAGGPYPLELSGGEPTVRDDLSEIIAMAKSFGFTHIQVNTNGIRIAQDLSYLMKLKESGATAIFLQFDGLTDDVYRYIRGENLHALKMRALDNCSKARIATVIVPTLLPGINTGQIGGIIQCAKQWVPIVKGVHFQPVSYFGRYPKPLPHGKKVTLPDVLNALELQTKGELKWENFLPPT